MEMYVPDQVNILLGAVEFTGGGKVRAINIKTQQIPPQSLRRSPAEEVEKLNTVVKYFGGASHL